MRQLEITIWQRVNRASSRAFGCTPRVGFSSLWQRDEVQKVEVSFGVVSGLFSKGYKVWIEKGYMYLFGNPNNNDKKEEMTESFILPKLLKLENECLIPWKHEHRKLITIV